MKRESDQIRSEDDIDRMEQQSINEWLFVGEKMWGWIRRNNGEKGREQNRKKEKEKEKEEMGYRESGVDGYIYKGKREYLYKVLIY